MFRNSKYKYTYILAKKVRTYLARPSRLIRDIRLLMFNRKLEKQVIQTLFDGLEEYLKYKNEVLDSGLINEIYRKRNLYEKIVKGKNVHNVPYNIGSINIQAGIKLYCLIRKYKPAILVETGVCNGVSTSFILLAVHKNQKGKLYSIDYPEHAGKLYQSNVFWEGKGGSAIPGDKTSGWMIPEYLKNHWKLILGKSQDKLPPLLKELKQIDFFMHDSEHTYDCMMFEFNEAHRKLSEKGFILSDNITSNGSFFDFCKKNKLKPFKISGLTGIALDPKKYNVPEKNEHRFLS